MEWVLAVKVSCCLSCNHRVAGYSPGEVSAWHIIRLTNSAGPTFSFVSSRFNFHAATVQIHVVINLS